VSNFYIQRRNTNEESEEKLLQEKKNPLKMKRMIMKIIIMKMKIMTRIKMKMTRWI
jgi:hypothetical protein